MTVRSIFQNVLLMKKTIINFQLILWSEVELKVEYASMVFFKRQLLLVFMLLVINVTYADEPFIIVTDPWPPYVYLEKGKPVGIDVDIALSVLSTLGIEGKIIIMPWKRSLAQVKSLRADAILSAAITEHRKEFLYFPPEAISSGSTVFFVHTENMTKLHSLKDLEGLRIGAMLGYKYCPELDDTPLLLSAARVSSLRQSFNMLLNKHVSAVVEVDAVGFYKAKEMGITDKISIMRGSRFCTVENHLAFSKKPGYDLRAQEFGEALVRFKLTDEYKNILVKYGMDAD